MRLQNELDTEKGKNRRLEGEKETLQTENEKLTTDDAKLRAPKWVTELAGLDGSDTSDNDYFQSATVQHMRGQKEDINVGNLSSSKSVSGAGAGISLPSDWKGIEFSQRPNFAFGQKAYLYTNLAAPDKPEAKREFWKVHGGDALTGVMVSLTENTATVASNDREGIDGSIKITDGTAIPTDSNGKRIVSGQPYTKIEVDATFGDTPGKLVCATGCVGTVGGDGDAGSATAPVTAYFTRSSGKSDFAAGWTAAEFKANSLTAAHDRPQDETYLYFGYWMNNPRDASVDPDFKWIGGGSSTTLALNPLTGSATYKGRAVGRYAINIPGGEVGAGMFNAKVTLTADFSDENTAGMVDGSISEFKADSPSAKDWYLKLGKIGIGQQGDIPSVNGVSSIVVPVAGKWEATLYGVNNPGYSSGNGGNKPTGAKCDPSGCAADVAGFAGWFRADNDTDDANNDATVAIGGTFMAE